MRPRALPVLALLLLAAGGAAGLVYGPLRERTAQGPAGVPGRSSGPLPADAAPGTPRLEGRAQPTPHDPVERAAPAGASTPTHRVILAGEGDRVGEAEGLAVVARPVLDGQRGEGLPLEFRPGSSRTRFVDLPLRVRELAFEPASFLSGEEGRRTWHGEQRFTVTAPQAGDPHSRWTLHRFEGLATLEVEVVHPRAERLETFDLWGSWVRPAPLPGQPGRSVGTTFHVRVAGGPDRLLLQREAGRLGGVGIQVQGGGWRGTFVPGGEVLLTPPETTHVRLLLERAPEASPR